MQVRAGPRRPVSSGDVGPSDPASGMCRRTRSPDPENSKGKAQMTYFDHKPSTGAAGPARPGRHVLLAASAVLAALATGATPAAAQQTPAQAAAASQERAARVVNRDTATPNRMTLMAEQPAGSMRVTKEEVYKGFRASRLMGQGVYGPNGNKIGGVQDVLVDPNGQIVAIVVEAGGFLDIGDAAFRVAWREVDLTPGRDGVKIPITEATAERYGLFDGPETLATGPRVWRVSELLGDYARLRDGVGYGYVRDAVFSREGKLSGVLVTRDVTWGGGLYGYPFYGYGHGWTPGLGYYGLPYADAGLAAAAPRIEPKGFTISEPGIL